jgi:hypothetical protein
LKHLREAIAISLTNTAYPLMWRQDLEWIVGKPEPIQMSEERHVGNWHGRWFRTAFWAIDPPLSRSVYERRPPGLRGDRVRETALS